jgi:hypothetical protein
MVKDARARVQPSTSVVRVEQIQERVNVHTATGQVFKARAGIVTVPMKYARPHRILTSPLRGQARRRARKALQPAHEVLVQAQAARRSVAGPRALAEPRLRDLLRARRADGTILWSSGRRAPWTLMTSLRSSTPFER